MVVARSRSPAAVASAHDAMDDRNVLSQAEADVLAFDVPDEALERAASAEQKAFTLVYCTNPWYNCGLPQ